MYYFCNETNIIIMKSTQLKDLLNHLKKRKSITSMEAINIYGITRLSARIFELRENHIIDSIPVTSKNRYNRPVTFTKYVYRNEK